jgi:hypothetical protein
MSVFVFCLLSAKAITLTSVSASHRAHHHNTSIRPILLGGIRVVPLRRRLPHSWWRIFKCVEWRKCVRFQALHQVGRSRCVEGRGIEESGAANPDVESGCQGRIASESEKLKAWRNYRPQLLRISSMSVRVSSSFEISKGYPNHACVWVISRDKSSKRGILIV